MAFRGELLKQQGCTTVGVSLNKNMLAKNMTPLKIKKTSKNEHRLGN